MDDADIAGRAQGAHPSYSSCVHAVGLGRLLFRAVHCRVGGGVDDELGMELVELAGQLIRVADIQFGAVRRP